MNYVQFSNPSCAKFICILLISTNFLVAQIFAQNFLSLIQPFLGGGGVGGNGFNGFNGGGGSGVRGGGNGGEPYPPYVPPPPPRQHRPRYDGGGGGNFIEQGQSFGQQQQGFGGIGQFINAFQQLRNPNSGGGGGGNNGFMQVANAAQGILSAFTNSDGASSGGFGEYLKLGQNFGLGSALDAPSPSYPQSAPRRSFSVHERRTPRQAPPFLPPLPNFFDLFKGIGKGQRSSRLRDRGKGRYTQGAPPISGRTRSFGAQSGSPVIRLTDTFGRNFVGMLDELYEYAQQVPGSPFAVTPAAPLLPTLPSLQSFIPPWIPTLAPPPQPVPANEDETFSATNLISGDPLEVARDFLDANQLMRKFLRVMSKDANKGLRPMSPMRDGTEVGRNRPLMDQLFESDILLTSRQMKAIVLAEAERRRRRKKRKVITGAAYRWPRSIPIPFQFRESDEEWRTLIRKGLKKWEDNTCIRFKENAFGKDRIEFIRGGGCYSSVGRIGGTQRVSIGYGCDDKGIVSHEVGHALGFWHEQSRPDRETYIYLNEKYILGGTDGNFAKRSDLETDGMGLPYDLGSVMHYGPNAFTTDWDHNTIITRDKKYQRSIGQRVKPSFIDVKQINRLYCHHVCQGTTIVCQNGGYADPNDCQRCKCPEGLGGPTCEDVEKSESALCGGEISATGIWQHLAHKIHNKRCVWRIRADQPNKRIMVILDSVDYQCDTTCRSFIEIKHNSDFQQIGFRSCCKEQKNVEVLSEQSELIVISDPHKSEGSFTLRYIADERNGLPLPKPPPPIWVPGNENRPFRGVFNKGGAIEKFILNAIPHVRDPDRPVESVMSILTDYFASSLLGVSKNK